MIILIEPQYLPSIEYLCTISLCKEIILEGKEHFPKQTSRNRCHINTSHGVKMLTVPLAERHGKILTEEVQLEPGIKWRNNHWRSIESAYRKAPYFDYYFEELKRILFFDHKLLLDLNRDLLSFCLRSLGLQIPISVSVSYQKSLTNNVFDLRSVISDKKPFTSRQFYRSQPYYQVFGSEFASNLSFIDLLFCEGPRSLELIKASKALPNE